MGLDEDRDEDQDEDRFDEDRDKDQDKDRSDKDRNVVHGYWPSALAGAGWGLLSGPFFPRGTSTSRTLVPSGGIRSVNAVNISDWLD
jgi:hypothetical protein